MKKLLYLFTASLFVLSSCSSDDDNSVDVVNGILPKILKYTDVEDPLENVIYLSTYDGNKILSTKQNRGRTDYTYDGNFIVKKINYGTVGIFGKEVISDVTVYSYLNGKLVETSYVGAYSTDFPDGKYKTRTVFTHNTDGTVKREIYTKNYGIEIEYKSNYIEILTFANGNLVKTVETNSEINSVFTSTYEYDNKNNPLKNILGFSLLINHSEGEGSMSSVNNIVNYTSSYDSNIEPNVYKREYVYDANGYPSKITSYKKNSTTANRINEYTY
ncbi:hypothetical protein LNQ49_17160 [Flavobacterium sp. F-65]|jgi:hypothetical protein|uniref:YD repeat-containing protein n=1 Tax=Flavobacterium pisciphilum TaxID=2893755 RepID=A0ABS8MX09_9FLAO|nr:hypothetical protein [Flavobacterium sp. F-65]MCC9073309.1 hypothetical protein [Flavobacterium sp. F-65]